MNAAVVKSVHIYVQRTENVNVSMSVYTGLFNVSQNKS